MGYRSRCHNPNEGALKGLVNKYVKFVLLPHECRNKGKTNPVSGGTAPIKLSIFFIPDIHCKKKTVWVGVTIPEKGL